MALTSIEIIATIFALSLLIKMVVIVVNKKIWYNNVVKPMYVKNPSVICFIFAVLALIIFYFLIQELTIVQIFAVMAFTGVLISFGFLLYTKDLMPLTKKIYEKKFGLGVWIQGIVWIALALWVLYEVFLV